MKATLLTRGKTVDAKIGDAIDKTTAMVVKFLNYVQDQFASGTAYQEALNLKTISTLLSRTIAGVTFDEARLDINWVDLVTSVAQELRAGLPYEIAHPMEEATRYLFEILNEASNLSFKKELREDFQRILDKETGQVHLEALPPLCIHIIEELAIHTAALSDVLEAIAEPTKSTSFLAGRLAFSNSLERDDVSLELRAGVDVATHVLERLGTTLNNVADGARALLQQLQDKEFFAGALGEVMDEGLLLLAGEKKNDSVLENKRITEFLLQTTSLLGLPLEVVTWMQLFENLKRRLSFEVEEVRSGTIKLLEPVSHAFVAPSPLNVKPVAIRRAGAKLLLGPLWNDLLLKPDESVSKLVLDAKMMRRIILELNDKLYANRIAVREEEQEQQERLALPPGSVEMKPLQAQDLHYTTANNDLLSMSDLLFIHRVFPYMLQHDMAPSAIKRKFEALERDLDPMRKRKCTGMKERCWTEHDELAFLLKKRNYYFLVAAYVIVKYDITLRLGKLTREIPFDEAELALPTLSFDEMYELLCVRAAKKTGNDPDSSRVWMKELTEERPDEDDM